MTSSWRSVAVLLGPPAAYLLLLLAHPSGGLAVELVLGHVVYLVPAVLLLHRGWRHREERPWVVPLAGGILAFVVGADSYALQVATDGAVDTKVVNAVANICVVPLFLVSILTALRRHLRKVGWIVALDGVTGVLAAGAVGLGSLSRLIDRVWDGSLASAAPLVYPAADVLLAAAALGALGLVGVRDGRHFTLWAVGLVVFAFGDIRYAYLLAQKGPYETGTWLDAVWAIGCSLMALGAASLRDPRSRRVPGTGSLTVITISALAGVGVLVAAPFTGAHPVPTALAVAALLCCGVRFLLAFRQLSDLTAVKVLALTDELTGVANRRALNNELDAFFDAPRSPSADGGPSVALLLVDLDHFKEVNDSFGHATGDELLRAVVARFAAVTQELDAEHLISRLGGDEFAVLIHGVRSTEAAAAAGEALLRSLAEPVTVDGVHLHVRGRVGIALAPEHARSRSDLLFAADAAMFAAKSSEESVTCYSAALAGDRRRRFAVAEDLYLALEQDQLVLEYQPIVAADGAVAGVEALVRWDHPVHGRLPPAEFLPAAERHRLTSLVAERVLDVALGDVARWHSAGRPLGVSVNVSASDLSTDKLVDTIAGALVKHGVAPTALTIEVTESAMMRDPDAALAVMAGIADLGVRLSVDDYGTGYSSLEYLLRLPISEIKLDRAFSSDLTAPRSVAIVKSTIDLTHALGLHMVAEGVEDEATLRTLRELGCDLLQGWHLGRPASAEVFWDRMTAPLSPSA